MKSNSHQNTRVLLNTFFTDVYKQLDPLSIPTTMHESITNTWKAEWKRIKEIGFAPDSNLTRYRFSFFMFGSDNKKKGYKPNRSVKCIVESFCRRFPIQDYFTIVWSETDPDLFMYYLNDDNESEEKTGPKLSGLDDIDEEEVSEVTQDNLVTQPDVTRVTDEEEGWSKVPGEFNLEKSQSPKRTTVIADTIPSATSNRYGTLSNQSEINSNSDEGVSYATTTNSHDETVNTPDMTHTVPIAPPIVPKVPQPISHHFYPKLTTNICKEIEQAIENQRVDDVDEQLLAEWILSSATKMVKQHKDNMKEMNAAVNNSLASLKQHKLSLVSDLENTLVSIRKDTAKAKIDCENLHLSYQTKIEFLEHAIENCEDEAISSINSVSNASIETIKSLQSE